MSEETETDGVSEETETGATTELTEETETETDTYTTGTYETLESTTEYAESASRESLREERLPSSKLLPQEILQLEGRHIRAEDFQWGLSPVETLAEMVVEAVVNIETPELPGFLKNATPEQRKRIIDLLSLDLPLEITLPLFEEESYWKRMCLRFWPAFDIWRYSNNWKSMFAHRSLQEKIENFDPNTDDILDLYEDIKLFSNYVTSLKISKLLKVIEEEVRIDLSSENFDEQLDEIIAAPQSSIYFSFEKVFKRFAHLYDLAVLLSPRYLNHEDFHFNIADFNSFFRGLHKLTVLKRFRISNGSFTNEQLTVILKIFLTHSSLTDLNLSYNFIDNETCDYIAKLLLSKCPLVWLSLKRNKITDEGAKSIASALSENMKLRKLDLSLNMIGDKGGSFLANALCLNNTLTDLDISKNKMTLEAGVAFAKLIRKSENLRSVKIQENFLGEPSGKLFLNALSDNQKLLELDVHYCGFKNEDEGDIHQAILRNRCKMPYSTYVKENEHNPAAGFLF